MPDSPEMPEVDEVLSAVRTLIRWAGDDPDRPGLKDTPQRVLNAWADWWGKGYDDANVPEIKLFEGDVPANGQMIVQRNIRFWSHCEHHMAPFFGTCAIGYIPSRKGVVGLSKLSRVVDLYSRRLQVQERLNEEIANHLAHEVSDHVGVVMRAYHTCMSSRGVMQPEAETTTSVLLGDFMDDASTRAEFLALCRQKD